MTDKPTYPTDAEWLAATPDGIIQTTGRCDNRTRHDAHTFTAHTFSTHVSGFHCYGQYAECANCDDRKCMSCVCREWHDDCRDDCPECCAPVSQKGSYKVVSESE